jgi:hypothetical protein
MLRACLTKCFSSRLGYQNADVRKSIAFAFARSVGWSVREWRYERNGEELFFDGRNVGCFYEENVVLLLLNILKRKVGASCGRSKCIGVTSRKGRGSSI